VVLSLITLLFVSEQAYFIEEVLLQKAAEKKNGETAVTHTQYYLERKKKHFKKGNTAVCVCVCVYVCVCLGSSFTVCMYPFGHHRFRYIYINTEWKREE
jgi:hypothetical protein